jgi:hypothetical protein
VEDVQGWLLANHMPLKDFFYKVLAHAYAFAACASDGVGTSSKMMKKATSN